MTETSTSGLCPHREPREVGSRRGGAGRMDSGGQRERQQPSSRDGAPHPLPAGARIDGYV